jgi:hypothetical protein
VDLPQNIKRLPFVGAGLVGAGSIFISRAGNRLGDLDRTVILAQVKVRQGVAVLKAVEVAALGIELGEPLGQLVNRLEVLELGERADQRETGFIGKWVCRLLGKKDLDHADALKKQSGASDSSGGELATERGVGERLR